MSIHLKRGSRKRTRQNIRRKTRVYKGAGRMKKSHKRSYSEGSQCVPSTPNACGTWNTSGNLYCHDLGNGKGVCMPASA